MKTLLKKKGIIGLLLAFMLVFPFMISSTVYAANDISSIDAEDKLAEYIKDPSQMPAFNNARLSAIKAKYEKSDNFKFKSTSGGNLGWQALTTGKSETYIDPVAFQQLTAGAKQDFLKKVFEIANCLAEGTAQNDPDVGSTGITDDTLDNMMHVIQNYSGMGSSMLATLLANTKPNYASASRLFAPFSGVVGTILGIIAIAIMALLGVTMALDLAFINIPAFQMFCSDDGSDGEGGNKSGGKSASGIGALISQEAKNAVRQATNQEGGNGDKGNQKSATGLYFKSRWKGLLLLGICLLYLVQGQIYSLVAWVIDLVSGFIGA